jgi:hypothetical protein
VRYVAGKNQYSALPQNKNLTQICFSIRVKTRVGTKIKKVYDKKVIRPRE